MLVKCASYQDGYKRQDLTLNELPFALQQPNHMVWLGFKNPTLTELTMIQDQFDLHDLAIEDIQQGHQRPKIEEYTNTLFFVVHTVELDQDNLLLLGEISIFMGVNYIIHVTNHTYTGFENIYKKCEKKPELLANGPGFVLYSLIDTIVDRYVPIVENLHEQLETIEEAIFSKFEFGHTNIAALYNLKRQLLIIHHAVSSLLEAVNKLQYHGTRGTYLSQTMNEYFRDISDHLTRLSKQIDNIREMTTTAIHVNVSLTSLEEAAITKKLASYAALFAIPTAIAGIYGMNFKVMPELEWTYGYPMVMTLIVVIDLVLWWRFRRAGWI